MAANPANLADIAVVLIIILSVFNGRRKTLSYFISSIITKIISIGASIFLYGRVSSILRQTALFDIVKTKVSSAITFENFTKDAPVSSIYEDSELLKTLFDNILANNNDEIYKFFRVETYADYLSSYLANIILNIISIILVYLIVSVLVKTVFKSIGLLTRVPVVKHLNILTGIVWGFISSVILIWMLMLILTIGVLQGQFASVYELVLTSKLAIYFLKYNIFTKIIFAIIP